MGHPKSAPEGGRRAGTKWPFTALPGAIYFFFTGSQGVEGKQHISRLMLSSLWNYSLNHHLGDFLITE